MITIFTPSFADEANTNAQNLTVKEVVARLPPDRFRVIMLADGAPDPRILARPNTVLLSQARRGNTARWLSHILFSHLDIYFFPREGPLDSAFLALRRSLHLPVSLVTYIVMALDHVAVSSTLQRCILQADKVIGNSRYVSQTITDRYHVPSQPIYDGIDFHLFHPPAQPRIQAPLRVLYAGSLQSRKRVDVVIREAAKFPSVDFRLAGRGEEESSLRALVSELNCRNVTFLGHLSQLQLAAEMQSAHLFVFPSILEGHPQVLAQAAASGLPSLAMDNYHPDFMVNGETGYLVKSESELGDKLRSLLTDQNLRLKFSAAAARHALQFDWDAVTPDWERVFQEVVTTRRKS